MDKFRQVAEMALEALENVYGKGKRCEAAIKELRQALADEAMAHVWEQKKKQWVGLTDADIAKAMHGSVEGSNMLPYQFARAIEQALKEKNSG